MSADLESVESLKHCYSAALEKIIGKMKLVYQRLAVEGESAGRICQLQPFVEVAWSCGVPLSLQLR